MNTLLAIALIVSSGLVAAGQVADVPKTTADEVMAKVYVRDRQREKVSQGYAGQRRYVLDNEKWNKRAVLVVAVKADPNGSKHFEVVSEEGWKSANKRVLRKMLESESETSRPDMRPKTLLTPENYSFALLQTEVVAGRPMYVIAVDPKRKDKYLFEGQIWVDGVDYAVVRCEGKPARNPSFWIHSVHFVHRYQKSGDFWFPNTTESLTDARIFGKTEVTIHYFDYAPNTAPEHEAETPHNASFKRANYVASH